MWNHLKVRKGGTHEANDLQAVDLVRRRMIIKQAERRGNADSHTKQRRADSIQAQSVQTLHTDSHPCYL